MKIHEDIFISDVEWETDGYKECVLADLKRACHPLGKHLGLYCFAEQKARIPSSHPASDFCHSYPAVTKEAKNISGSPYKVKDILYINV